MSKHETPMTRAYWETIGGTLIEEYMVVPIGKNQGKRVLDGLILADGPRRRITERSERRMAIKGKNVIVVQTKASRLGMYLMGQAYFSKRLVELLEPASVRTVALCTAEDAVLGPIAREAGIEVVVMPAGGNQVG